MLSISIPPADILGHYFHVYHLGHAREDYSVMISEYLHFVANERYREEDVRNTFAEMAKITIAEMLKEER